MISKPRLNLFPILFEYKKYGLRFRRIGHCCNNDYYTLRGFLLLYFILFDIYYWRCPKCGRLHAIKMSWHTEEYSDKRIMDENSLLRKWD